MQLENCLTYNAEKTPGIDIAIEIPKDEETTERNKIHTKTC